MRSSRLNAADWGRFTGRQPTRLPFRSRPSPFLSVRPTTWKHLRFLRRFWWPNLFAIYSALLFFQGTFFLWASVRLIFDCFLIFSSINIFMLNDNSGFIRLKDGHFLDCKKFWASERSVICRKFNIFRTRFIDFIDFHEFHVLFLSIFLIRSIFIVLLFMFLQTTSVLVSSYWKYSNAFLKIIIICAE